MDSAPHSPVGHTHYSENTQQHGPSRAASTRVRVVAAERRCSFAGGSGRVSIPQTDTDPIHCWLDMALGSRAPAAGSSCCAASPVMFPCCCLRVAEPLVVIRRDGYRSDARDDDPWVHYARGRSMRCYWSVGRVPWVDRESGGIQRCDAQHFGVSPPWLTPGQQYRRPIEFVSAVSLENRRQIFGSIVVNDLPTCMPPTCFDNPHRRQVCQVVAPQRMATRPCPLPHLRSGASS